LDYRIYVKVDIPPEPKGYGHQNKHLITWIGLLMNQKELTRKKEAARKPFEVAFSKGRESMVLKVVDPEAIYPLYLQDPEAGTYRIIKTASGKIQMIR
jgi:desulfoferrodoxin (superoxide reductase-like protein)